MTIAFLWMEQNIWMHLRTGPKDNENKTQQKPPQYTVAEGTNVLLQVPSSGKRIKNKRLAMMPSFLY